MADFNNNPWKGLDSYSFSDNSIFYGRTNETETLTDTILNNRFTILYGPSGVGKSSLLNAGIRPKLSEDSFFVVDISMRQLDLRSERSISAQILARVKECAKEAQIEIAPLSKNEGKELFEDSLWFFFHTNEFWSSKNEFLTPIVIIDQFEDIFKDEVKELSTDQFFNSLDELSNVVPPMSMREKLQNMDFFRYNQSADFRFVFSLREDYLPRLDDYVYSLNIPELRKSRYSITLMDTNQAKEVILGPANGIVSENVSDKIISILSSQTSRNRLLHKVEPFLLSLFMYRVYIEMAKRGLSTISEELINKLGADVVNDYYLESMKKVSAKAMKHLENVLLTPKGHRDSISYDKLMESEKVTEDELNILLSSRIIKKNTINNVDRFEFTHDILSKYAQKNKQRREQNNKSQIYVGYMGTLLTLVFSGVVGWIMSNVLTYISIPILVIASIVCSFGIHNIKLSISKKWAWKFLAICGVLGICLDLIQLIPGVGYIIYVLVCMISLYTIFKFSDYLVTESKITKYGVVIYVWLLSFIIIPVLCYGYNIYSGMNYSRSSYFSSELFYIKNGQGKYGLRNRKSVVVRPHYDDTLLSVGKDYVAVSDGKCGLLADSKSGMLDSVIMPIKYDSFVMSGNKAYFYSNGKEVSENGIEISWGKLVSNIQKETVRDIVNKMIFVKGGHFNMGTDIERAKKRFPSFKPTNGEEFVHDVELSDFYLGKCEVSVSDWYGIMGEYPKRNEQPMNFPVRYVSYEDCIEFVEKLKEMTGLSFSLPTEAQWEYAARGGNKHEDFLYAGSNYSSQVGWTYKNTESPHPHPIGEKGKEGENALGILDMTGNVAEFCKDYMSSKYYIESKGQKDPCYDVGNTVVVKRGGSYKKCEPENLIVTRRLKALVKYIYDDVGFRIAINSHQLSSQSTP